jgi:hypothetical protein
MTPPPPAPVTPPPTYAKAEEPRRNRWFNTQMGIMLGGGYADFGGDAMQNLTEGGGAWDFRLVIGAHAPIAIELGYVGTANSVEDSMGALGMDPNAALVSNAFEGNLRLSTPALRTVPVQLFGFAGAGVNEFDVVNADFNNSPMRNGDTTFVLPAGGGLQLNLTKHVTLDGRFTYRAMFEEDLLLANENADMYTATARFGWVF